MAIKGKKKSQSRGSQARRRPAAAPRAVGPGRRRPPWYKTPQGRAAIVAFLLIVAAVVTGFVLKARSNSAKLADRQEALETYTSSIRGVLQSLTPPATDMLDVPLDAGDFAGLSRLPKRAKRWEDTINKTIDQLVALEPPPKAILVQGALEQSGQLYLTTARLFEIMADQPDKTRGELLAETATLRDQANTLWANGILLLDEYRAELDMDPAGLPAPATGPTTTQPTPILTEPGAGGDGVGPGGGGGRGGGAGDKKGAKNDSG